MFEKLVKGIPCLEVIEQIFNWHACPDEYGRSPLDSGVGMNDRMGHGDRVRREI